MKNLEIFMSEKLNLNKSAVDFYWKNTDPRMLKILHVMESVEIWVVDDVESISKELIAFGKKLGNTKTAKLAKRADEITTIMTYIFSSKSLRMLNWLDDNFPGLSFQYVMEAKQKDDREESRLLLDRLRTIKSLDLLGLIFTTMRTRLISGLLEEDQDDD